MSRFSNLVDKSSAVIDRHLSDCWVTVGNTTGLADSLHPSLSPESIYNNAQNIQLRGLFEQPYTVDLETEGVRITLGMELPAPLSNQLNKGILRRGDRLLITPDGQPPVGVFGITSVQPDGARRVLCHLQIMNGVIDGGAAFVQDINATPLVFIQ